MAALIRPTLLLQMSLDAGSFSDDVVAEIRRSYSYVAPTLVECHETGEAAPENTVRFVVKIRNLYWKSADEGADSVWNDIMLKWLANMFEKTSTTMVAYNKIRAEKNEPALNYAWIDVEFGEDMVLSLRLNADSSIPQTALESIAQVRACMNDGTLDGGAIAGVRIPSRASFDTQAAMLCASGDVAEANESVDHAATGTCVDEGSFVVSTWGIEYSDGSVREFDSQTRTFIA